MIGEVGYSIKDPSLYRKEMSPIFKKEEVIRLAGGDFIRNYLAENRVIIINENIHSKDNSINNWRNIIEIT